MAAFLMMWLTLLAARGTPLGRQLRRVMVELPAATMDRVRRVHVVLAAVVVGLIFLHVMAGENDPVRRIALAAPEAAMWLSSFELSALADITVTFAAAFAAIRDSEFRLPPSVRPWRGREATRARRTHRTGRIAPANDDEDPAGRALAG